MLARAVDMAPTRAGHRLIVAGGGTGGHLFPGIAVAQAFMARHGANRVLFVNAGRPLEVDVLTRLGWPFETIPIEGIKQRRIWHQVAAAWKIPNAVRLSAQIVKAFDPDVVLGVGGYSAGPVVTAAWLLGKPTVVHEQNQLPGLTNRLLSRIAKRIYLTFEDQDGRFDFAKVLVTGNPVRDEILMVGGEPEKPRDLDQFAVLVVGGSQGAHAINQAMVDALGWLKQIPGLMVMHQTGNQDVSWVRQAYLSAGVKASVQPFFNDMAERYRRSDLVVCRAGATTVAEITAIGRTAIFIPFPQAADDHQTRNAQALVESGGAEMIAQSALNGERLAEKILGCVRDRTRLTQMAGCARSLGRPEAALTIVRDIYALIEG